MYYIYNFNILGPDLPTFNQDVRKKYALWELLKLIKFIIKPFCNIYYNYVLMLNVSILFHLDVKLIIIVQLYTVLISCSFYDDYNKIWLGVDRSMNMTCQIRLVKPEINI